SSLLRSLTKAVTAIVSLLVSPAVLAGQPGAVLDSNHAKVQQVMAVQQAVTASLMRQPEILGTAVGLDRAGEPALVIYVDRGAQGASEAVRALPTQIRGVSVKGHLTEKFVAYAGKPSRGESHTAKQTSPIQLGTSGGWRYDLANGYCCGGTLGSLVSINNEQYILSNYHVFESDIVSGGNSRVAQTGDFVIQPGLIDVGCNAANAQNVATLVTKSSLPGSNVDCSIAKAVSGMVNTSGSILEIGTISSQTVAASLS